MLQLLLMNFQLGCFTQLVITNMTHLLNMLQPAPGQVQFLSSLPSVLLHLSSEGLYAIVALVLCDVCGRIKWEWAARFNTWLLINFAPKGVVFSLLSGSKGVVVSFLSGSKGVVFSFLFFQDQEEVAGLEARQAAGPAAGQAAAATFLPLSSLKLAPSPRQTALPTGNPSYHMLLNVVPNMVLADAKMPSACESCLC